MAFGSQNMTNNLTKGMKKTPQTIKIDLPGNSPTGDGTMTPPKIKTTKPPVNPNPTAANAALVAGPGPTAQGLSSQSMAPSSYNGSPIGGGPGRTPRDEEGSLNTGGISNPMGGFSSRYDPTKLDPLYRDQGIILDDLLRAKGMPIGSGRAEMGDYANRAGAIASLLSLYQQGANPNAGSDEAWINSVAEILNNSMGAGGTAIDYNSALGMLMGDDPNRSLLDLYLYGSEDDPQTLAEQQQWFEPMLMASITGMNPTMQRAMVNAYTGAQNAANTDLTHGAADPRIGDYLRRNLAGVIPSLR